MLSNIQTFFNISDSTAGLLQTGKTLHLTILLIWHKKKWCNWIAERSWRLQDRNRIRHTHAFFAGLVFLVIWINLLDNVLSVFICSFLLLAPVFGYLGDRYNRKYIMIVGLTVWLGTAAGSSFVTESVSENDTQLTLWTQVKNTVATGSHDITACCWYLLVLSLYIRIFCVVRGFLCCHGDHIKMPILLFVHLQQFWLLLLLRGLVGIGEASYSTIAPTIIGDLFTGGKRSVVICIFYIFIPFGRYCNRKLTATGQQDFVEFFVTLCFSGLGYITGAGCATLTGDWHWALRVRTRSSFVLIILIGICLM